MRLTDGERQAIIDSIISSQELAGVTVSREIAEQALDRALEMGTQAWLD